jgi:hypothetical protein
MTTQAHLLARTIGKDGPKIPAIGFGLMGLSIAYGSVEYV